MGCLGVTKYCRYRPNFLSHASHCCRAMRNALQPDVLSNRFGGVRPEFVGRWRRCERKRCTGQIASALCCRRITRSDRCFAQRWRGCDGQGYVGSNPIAFRLRNRFARKYHDIAERCWKSPKARLSCAAGSCINNIL